MDLDGPKVVATVHSLAGLRLATRLRPGDVDFLELRVDALVGQLDKVRRTLPRMRLPVLLTVRHPAEGGIGKLSANRRRRLFSEFLDHAAVVDVELRAAGPMRDVIEAARAHGAGVVISDHHFHSTPTLRRMLEGRRRAFAAGADIFKIATMAGDARSLARLLDFTARNAGMPCSVMGMGRFGQVSRLALATAGSVLNYGYLDRPNAPGQWEARELKRLLVRLEV
jgi:3-dehydroquinate dehydratase-1